MPDGRYGGSEILVKTWFSSDQHFGHSNIIKFMLRPFADVEEMDYALITNWNSVVSPEDSVYVVGDFSFCRPESTELW